MKKVIEGTFAEIYYNECEAACPLGLLPKGIEDKTDPRYKFDTNRESLCHMIKKALDIRPDEGAYSEHHNLIGKKVMITIEVEVSDF